MVTGMVITTVMTVRMTHILLVAFVVIALDQLSLGAFGPPWQSSVDVDVALFLLLSFPSDRLFLFGSYFSCKAKLHCDILHCCWSTL